MIELEGYVRAFAALPAGIDEAEINAARTAETSVTVSGGVRTGGGSFDRTAFYVRAAAAGRTGMVYTEKRDEDPAAVLRRAAAHAALSGAREPLNGPLPAPASAALPDETPEELAAFAAAAERIAAGRGGRNARCTATVCRRELRTVNSRGLDSACETKYVAVRLETELPRAGGAPAAGTAQHSALRLDALLPEALAAAALADADAQDGGGLPSVRPESGVYDAVLSGQVMRNILMTAWQAFSGEAMEKGTSCFTPGERIGNPALRLVNAPSHPLVGQSWPADSEGTPVPETEVVRGGRLCAPLYTLASGLAAGRPSTGSAGRVARMTGDIPVQLTTVPALFYLAPGGGGDARALARRLGDGLLLTYSLDLFHSVNVSSGTFSIPCGGVLIRDGRPAGAVSQMTMAGTLRELFAALELAGDDLGFDDFYFRTYCVGSPAALVRGLRFAL